jgi:hypothetical protein
MLILIEMLRNHSLLVKTASDESASHLMWLRNRRDATFQQAKFLRNDLQSN